MSTMRIGVLLCLLPAMAGLNGCGDRGLKRERAQYEWGFEKCLHKVLELGEAELNPATLLTAVEMDSEILASDESLKVMASNTTELSRLRVATAFGLGVLSRYYEREFLGPRGWPHFGGDSLRNCNHQFMQYLSVNKQRLLNDGWKSYLKERKFNFQAL